ncbi:hypothetical protein PT273_06955 [Orbaceae bacterium ESL0727]|nr:hypothetical protein [Orbaceae bacterium ESL0727]
MKCSLSSLFTTVRLKLVFGALLFIIALLFILTRFINWDDHNKNQSPLSVAQPEQHFLTKNRLIENSSSPTLLQQQNNCVNEIPHTLKQMDSIAAQGCPIDVK